MIPERFESRKPRGSRRRIDVRDRLAAASKQLRLAREQTDCPWQAAAIRALEADVARAAPLRFERASKLGNADTPRQFVCTDGTEGSL